MDNFLTRFFKGVNARHAPQVGAPGHPGAAMPLIHLNVDGPPSMRGIEQRGDDINDQENPTPVSSSARIWRTPATAPIASVEGDIHLSDDRGTAAQAHLSQGHPDWRRTEVAQHGSPSAPVVPTISGVERTNTQGQAEYAARKAAPERPRGGWTSADPARPSTTFHAFTVRPFDKGIADHPPTITKAAQPSPTAARPPRRSRLVGGRPFAGGSAGTATPGVGPQLNTVRSMPTPRDAQLVNRKTNNSSTTAQARARGWRL
jgi:hypothetical protein